MTDKEELVNSIIFSLADSCELSIKDLKATLEKEMYNYSVQKLNSTTITTKNGDTTKQFLTLFAESKSSYGMSKNTFHQYTIAISMLCRYCNKELNMISAEDITRFLSYYRYSGVKPVTVNNKFRLISSVFNFMFKHRYIDVNPMDLVETPKYSVERKKPLTVKELETIKVTCEKFKKKCKSTRTLAMLNLMLDTGVRVSEMCNIKLKDIDNENSTIRILGKGRKYRDVYFTDKARVRISEYLATRDDLVNNGVLVYNDNTPLFASYDKHHTFLKKDNVEREFREIGKLAGVPRLHPHLVRATFATRLADRGVNVNVIAELLGHANLNTLTKYVIVSNENKKLAVAQSA